MDGSFPKILLIIYFISFIFTIIVYKFSSAIQSISEAELEKISKDNEKYYKKIEKIINRPVKFVNTIQVITALNMFIAGLFIGILKTNLLEFVLYTSVLVIAELAFGIVIPKKMGNKNRVKYATKYVSIVSITVVAFTPITFLISFIAGIILKFMGIDLREYEENVTEEDIMSVINEGHEQGVLLASEAEMISNIVEFGDKEAKDIMTHRTSVIAVDGSKTLKEISDYIVNQNNSRFPVYIDDIDNILGIVNFRDIMRESVKGINNDKKICEIEDLVRTAVFIPETKKINLLFKNMQSEKIHMAIVVDEYGQTSGIVAMEDILEEIVGNILDEYDKEDVAIIRKEDGSFVVKGTYPLSDISEETGIVFDEDCETINGYLTYKFGRVLSNEERPEIIVNNIKYKVLLVESRTIKLVHISIVENRK